MELHLQMQVSHIHRVLGGDMSRSDPNKQQELIMAAKKKAQKATKKKAAKKRKK